MNKNIILYAVILVFGIAAPFILPASLSKSKRDTLTDFSNPTAVYELNKALLIHDYGIDSRWSLPVGKLCPPIVGRGKFLENVCVCLYVVMIMIMILLIVV